jgi:hypothetical protein
LVEIPLGSSSHVRDIISILKERKQDQDMDYIEKWLDFIELGEWWQRILESL